MKAWFLEEFKSPYKLHTDAPVPQVSGPYDILVKIDAASYCHTDAVLASGSYVNAGALPIVGCHEFAGTIIDSASETFKSGDRIGIPGRSYRPCGECAECMAGPGAVQGSGDEEGYSVYCPFSQSNGLSRNGGFQEYAVVDSRQVARLPDGLRAVQAAPLMCAGITIFQALERCDLKPGQSVGIMGCGGGLGHLGLQFADKMGLRTVGVDVSDRALELAKSLKTSAKIVDARVESADEVAKQFQDSHAKHRSQMGLDAVIILPESQQAFDYGIRLLKNHSKCVVVSFPKDGFKFSCSDVVFRDISVVGSLVGSNKRLQEMLQFADHHGIKAVVREYSLDQLNELVDEYHRGGPGKLVLNMSL